ncbi:DUF1492 domain-containing protein [Clostridium sardiniense]|uniref:DUF1492 domain-containing protein n=1 Tax=Clostridium sardiniense TaxID=29369 RepID=UPI00195787FA|nr:DUF1492 domain-containing protein [Clostridium sardiniense]MBM7836429.1 DNA-directed RNA polymerase specialized sigma24 family protein [Clostridium sardiniense]
MKEYIEELLKNYRKNKFRINDIDIEIEEIQMNFEGIRGLNISNEKTGPTNKFNSDVENEIVNKENRIDQLTQNKIKLQTEIKRTENLLNYLEGRHEKVIKFRYIDGLKWSVISERLEISEPTCRKAREDAIEELSSILS